MTRRRQGPRAIPVGPVLRGLRDQVLLALATRFDHTSWLRRRLVVRASTALDRWVEPLDDPAAALHAAEASRWSQNGEDGLLAAILERVGPGERTFVEIGSSDGNENCTRALAEDGWHGVWFEADPGRAATARRVGEPLQVRVQEVTITSGNVVGLLDEAEVPVEPDVLVLDIDGSDLWVLRALLRSRAPRILVVEYNSTFPPGTFWTRRNRATYEWDETHRHGASLDAMAWAAQRQDYQLVACDSYGVNAFFVRADLAGPFTAAPLASLYRPLLIKPPVVGHPWRAAERCPLLTEPERSGLRVASATVRFVRPRSGQPGAALCGVDVELVNETQQHLTSGGPTPLMLSARLLDADGVDLGHECTRNAIIGGLPPQATVPATGLVDLEPGTHTLRVSLVQDGNAWIEGAVDLPVHHLVAAPG